MPANRNDGKVNLHLRIPSELMDRLTKEADDRVVSTNLLAVKALEQYLDRLVPVEEILLLKEKIYGPDS
jgi:predicted HicB family RNase H-like nuclease